MSLTTLSNISYPGTAGAYGFQRNEMETAAYNIGVMLRPGVEFAMEGVNYVVSVISGGCARISQIFSDALNFIPGADAAEVPHAIVLKDIIVDAEGNLVRLHHNYNDICPSPEEEASTQANCDAQLEKFLRKIKKLEGQGRVKVDERYHTTFCGVVLEIEESDLAILKARFANIIRYTQDLSPILLEAPDTIRNLG